MGTIISNGDYTEYEEYCISMVSSNHLEDQIFNETFSHMKTLNTILIELRILTLQ